MRLGAKDFDLASTVESGQLFRWSKEGDGYRIAHRDKSFFVSQEGDFLEFSGVTAAFLTSFFGLDVDYAAIKRKLSKDAMLRTAIKAYPGIHIVRQDPWECTVSFLCSSFSNIKKIQLNLRKLTECFGESGAFPCPGDIDDHPRIKSCSTGYRSKYIFEANKLVDDRSLNALKRLPYAEAKARLMELPGIGEKVADCICLFSLDKTEAFPVDVWIKRVIEELYFEGKSMKERDVRDFAKQRWGALAGYAQQYLYHWRRTL
ncbi:hypothetical protein HY493_00195 [Candidatus Woesearchaeota archaeon]|nr:hypothetical protein [Candidatus Woesearchaeota archaeon]